MQLHILELADILVERPSQYARRVEDISLIFKNLHHLLNSLRPHQVTSCLYMTSLLLSLFWMTLLIVHALLLWPYNLTCQARATLIHILELQIQRRKQAVEDIKRYASSDDLLGSLSAAWTSHLLQFCTALLSRN